MFKPWNLTPDAWSKVLGDQDDAQEVAARLTREGYLPWHEILENYTQDSTTVLDLGSGHGQHSALLALHGKKTTLFDWSEKNIQFSQKLFAALKCSGNFIQADMTQPLPFEDGFFDTVFSCGVFEYFTDEQIKKILKESFRVARKRVIILVPNEFSICYIVGMCYMKLTRKWQWGGERPFMTLKNYFKVVEDIKVTQFSVGTKHSLEFLNPLPCGGFLKKVFTKLFNLQSHARPSRFNQGYLLVTIGEKI